MRVYNILFAYCASAAYINLPFLDKNGSVLTACVDDFTAIPSLCGTAATSAVTHSTPTNTSAASASSPLSDLGYMTVVNKWRTKLRLSTLTPDAVLQANSFKTCVDGNGHMIHEIHPGSLAQVLAPGDINEDFERIFVGGWLCEKPNMIGMDGICATKSLGWFYNTSGHADILTSTSYTRIGCASFRRIVSCDLA